MLVSCLYRPYVKEGERKRVLYILINGGQRPQKFKKLEKIPPPLPPPPGSLGHFILPTRVQGKLKCSWQSQEVKVECLETYKCPLLAMLMCYNENGNAPFIYIHISMISTNSVKRSDDRKPF